MKPQDFKVGDRLAAEFGCDVRFWTVQAVDGNHMLVRADNGLQDLWCAEDLSRRKAVRLPPLPPRETFWSPIIATFRFWFLGAKRG